MGGRWIYVYATVHAGCYGQWFEGIIGKWFVICVSVNKTVNLYFLFTVHFSRFSSSKQTLGSHRQHHFDHSAATRSFGAAAKSLRIIFLLFFLFISFIFVFLLFGVNDKINITVLSSCEHFFFALSISWPGLAWQCRFYSLPFALSFSHSFRVVYNPVPVISNNRLSNGIERIRISLLWE